MDGQRRRDVAIALLTVLAIGLAAVAAAPMFADGPGNGSAADPETADTPSSDGSSALGEVPQKLWVAVLGVLFAAWQVVVYAILWVLSFLEPFDPDPPEENASFQDPLVDNRSEEQQTAAVNGSGEFAQGSDTPFALPIDEPVALVLFAAAVLLVAMVAIRYDAIQSVVRLVGGGEGSERDAGLDGIGRVAGEAADRVEAADSPEAAENAIYRAWTEMVDLLGVRDPQSDTPRRFADAAIDAGMDPDDVSALTGAFEEVRYGGASPSEERRRRATEAFRRIEAAYAADGDSGAEAGAAVDADHDPEDRE